MGWVREVVSRNAQPNKAAIYYISPDKMTKLRSGQEAIRSFQTYPQDDMSADNFNWKQRPMGLSDPKFKTLRTAKPQSPCTRPLMTLQPQLVFEDDPPQTVNVTSYLYHEEPGDLPIESRETGGF